MVLMLVSKGMIPQNAKHAKAPDMLNVTMPVNVHFGWLNHQ